MSFSCQDPKALMIEDGDERLSFFPSTVWKRANSQAGHTYSGGSMATTRAFQAQFSLPLNASHLWYYADTSIDHGTWEILVNGQSRGVYNASSAPEDNQLMWEGDLDPSREHQLVFKNLERKLFTLDVLCYLPTSVTSSSSTSASTSASGSSHSEPLQLGAILGIVFGIIAFVLGMSVIFVVLRDRSRQQRRSHGTLPVSHTNEHLCGVSMNSSQMAPLLFQTQPQRQSTERPSMSQESRSTGSREPSSIVVGWHRPNAASVTTSARRFTDSQARTHPRPPQPPTGPPPSYNA